MGLFTEAVKRMFSRNTTNAASQSGARVPIVNVNGDPIGNDSLANFASVLGGVLTNIQPNTTFESCKEFGIYRVDSTATARTISDIPETAGGTLVVSPAINTNFVRQEYQTRYNTYVRNCSVKEGVASSVWVKYEGVEMQS